jgi:hypothetical protein
MNVADRMASFGTEPKEFAAGHGWSLHELASRPFGSSRNKLSPQAPLSRKDAAQGRLSGASFVPPDHDRAGGLDVASGLYPVLSSFPGLDLPGSASDDAALFKLRSARARRGLKVEANAAGVFDPSGERGCELS